MDYYKIGQRIRKFRKAYRLSQEQLAEKVGISTTHMSHIETGNTKLSLPLFVKLANVLSIQTDELLHDTPQKNKTAIKGELEEILDSCSMQDIQIIEDVVKAVKVSLDKYREPD
ncbi:XRE family transcriptional regulator [Petralouisia muris]|jgi:transcriptional regulator with XRE-family HTH domain|uniref:XRE family transcriptional regulator n=1 Tax=Petralouisia muris TaxID=3032872 RepID=A0AC61RPU3_9FIRM|nr:helix-turn-helix transcriptional regulator [Petralouisia muris]MCI8860592.1 helix-turn-helix transcriptional regulator [Lachnospiraceae bacterium]TGY89464.1 XRE family transcriptional regulator [Petralouisia muris]